MAALAANAIHANCAAKVFGKREWTIRLPTRHDENTRDVCARQTGTTRRRCDHDGIARRGDCETLSLRALAQRIASHDYNPANCFAVRVTTRRGTRDTGGVALTLLFTQTGDPSVTDKRRARPVFGFRSEPRHFEIENAHAKPGLAFISAAIARTDHDPMIGGFFASDINHSVRDRRVAVDVVCAGPKKKIARL